MQENPNIYYEQAIGKLNVAISRKKRVRTVIAALRLLTFLTASFFVYRALYLNNSTLFAPAGLIFLSFLLLSILDTKITNQYKKLKTLLALNEQEQQYLTGNYSDLHSGKEYLDPAHPFALDLDVFGQKSLFQRLNRTITIPGQQQLAHTITNLEQDPEKIKETQEAIAEIAQHPDWIREFLTEGKVHETNVITHQRVDYWIENDKTKYSPGFQKYMYISGSINVIFIILWMFGFSYVPTMLLSIFHLGVVALKLKDINATNRHLDRFLQSFSRLRWLLKVFSTLDVKAPKTKHLQRRLLSDKDAALQGLNQLSRFADVFDQRLNIVVSVILNAVFMRDLIIVQNLAKWKQTYKDRLLEWTNDCAELDTLVSFANFRFNHPTYIFPELTSKTLLQAEDMGHPLIASEKCVTNTITLKTIQHFHIVTGANMAGKSTYLRTVGTNLVLAMCGLPVPAKSFRFKPMYLFTSMRTTDNLAEGFSYFHAELHRLSNLMKDTQQYENSFVILDELLKGTNSVDKLNGSLLFLKKIKELQISGIVATHDLGLGDLEKEFPDNFKNYCFEIEIEGDTISYSYKMQEGISKHMNASLLMKQMNLI